MFLFNTQVCDRHILKQYKCSKLVLFKLRSTDILWNFDKILNTVTGNGEPHQTYRELLGFFYRG